MANKGIMGSGKFLLVVVLLLIVLLPFGIEQIGEATSLYKFPAKQWVTGLFVPKSGASGQKPVADKTDWNKHLQDLKAFSEWVDGQSDVKISIVRPTDFQIVRANENPATTTSFSWELLVVSGNLNLDATQVRGKLELICEPAGKVSGRIASVKRLGGGKTGFLVSVDSVQGEGKVGLSYAGGTPMFYDVKLRRVWNVPVASCRSALVGHYQAEVFFPGIDRGLAEGAVISPSNDKCGYRILSISDRCVWFEAFYGDEPPAEALPYSVWPDFSRIDTLAPTPPPGRLIFGKSRCFWPGDAIKLPSSDMYLMVDDLLVGRSVVFRLLDSSLHPVRDLLCVIVREKR